jgi:long-subunit acyl-CoA synthetase (AMP-forming)
MIEAIRRTTAKEYKKVSAALIPVLPDLVTALGQVITDNQTTPAQRLQAAGMLQALWARCLRDEDRKQKHLTNRERLRVKRRKVEVADRQATLELAAERKRIDRVLEQAKKELESR